MTAQWWTQEHEHEYNGQTYTERTRTTGVVWDENNTHDENGQRRYLAWVRVAQGDHQDTPGISLWLWNGATPPPMLTVEDARTLGHALVEAAELVDAERDTAIRRLLDT